jgi:isorenieratene synthase
MITGFRPQPVPLPYHGHADRVTTPTAAVVVGGGLAGAAAALVLAERGASVTLVEKEAYLGGRVGAWTDHLAGGEPFEMERGFHAFFRQYYNVRRFLKRVDPGLAGLLRLDDYPLLGPQGARESFTGLPLRTPLNLIALVARTERLRLADVIRARPEPALAMMAYHPEHTYTRHDAGNAKDYLDSLGFPPDARQMLFSVFAHSFFNPEERMSAADLVAMFHFYFLGNPEGLVFDVETEPFETSIWTPVRRHLEGLGVTVRTGCPARRVERTGSGFRVILEGDQALPADGVVLGLSVPALRGLVDASTDLGAPGGIAGVRRLDVTSPFAVLRLWLDRPVRAERSPFAGTTGLGTLDNVSVYERFEGESRRWALRRGGSVVELHAYAVPDEMAPEAVRADLVAQLHGLYPETREARILEERYLWKQDCPAFPPGSAAYRPEVATSIPGLALAGDFVHLPFPSALMERAVASGFLAASHLLDRQGVRPEPLWSVPPEGLLAPFSRFL